MNVANRITVFAVAFLLVACAADDTSSPGEVDCAKSLCGCYTDISMPVTLRISDADNMPIAHARLICHDDSSYLGTTGSDGILTLSVPGRTSPGCGFMPDCQVAYFRTEAEQFGRHFWFARFVRGEDVSARAHAVQRVNDTD